MHSISADAAARQGFALKLVPLQQYIQNGNFKNSNDKTEYFITIIYLHRRGKRKNEINQVFRRMTESDSDRKSVV